MTNPFRLRIPLTIGQVTLRFLEPDPAERKQAGMLAEKYMRKGLSDEEAREICLELEAFLVGLVDSVSFPDGQAIPEDWKQQLASSRLLLGYRGIDALLLLFQHTESVVEATV